MQAGHMSLMDIRILQHQQNYQRVAEMQDEVHHGRIIMKKKTSCT